MPKMKKMEGRTDFKTHIQRFTDIVRNSMFRQDKK